MDVGSMARLIPPPGWSPDQETPGGGVTVQTPKSFWRSANIRPDTIIVPFSALEEVLLLSEAGRIHIPLPFREFVISLDKAENVDLGVNDTAVLLEAATFTTIRDPFDRMIVAQARVAGVPLITGDDEIHESGLVRTVWD
jgi:PIN domain nuclease of toxin-antitoxin system